MEAASL